MRIRFLAFERTVEEKFRSKAIRADLYIIWIDAFEKRKKEAQLTRQRRVSPALRGKE